MRRAGGRLGLRRNVGGGHRGTSRPQCSDRREGAALRRHHRALRRLALDSRHLAGARLGHHREPRPGADLSAARGRQQFRCRARRCVSLRRSRSGRFFHQQDRCALRHAADVSGLSRRGARRRAGRPLDGDAAVRRPRTGRAHQEPRQPPARTHRVRHDAGLGQGDRPLHARDQIADLGDLCGEAPVEACDRRDAPRPRHDADQRQCARRTPRQIGVRPEDTAVAVVAGARTDRRGRRGARRGRRTPWQAGPRQRQARRRAGLRRLPARRRQTQGDVPARGRWHRAFLAGACRQYRRRLAAGGSRRRPRRGQFAECRGLGAGLDHRAQGRHARA